MKTAFVTYNTVGRNGLKSGWHNGANGAQALVLQNTKGEEWGAGRGPMSFGYTPREGENLSASRQEEIGNLWVQLRGQLSEIDHLVVYVGANGSQRAVALSAQLPPERVTYVLCDCSLPAKEEVIRLMGMSDASRVMCECGGHRTMEAIFSRYMEEGEVATW